MPNSRPSPAFLAVAYRRVRAKRAITGRELAASLGANLNHIRVVLRTLHRTGLVRYEQPRHNAPRRYFAV